MNKNILFFLTPKSTCKYVHAEDTIRQALERMEKTSYTALPILNKRGEYCGTLTEGDLLWALKNLCGFDMRKAQCRRITEIAHRKDNTPVKVCTSMNELIGQAAEQNFVPVIDDKNTFIGIITRRAIMKYCQERFFTDCTEDKKSEPALY